MRELLNFYAIVLVVVGEYACDYGFKLPNPVSMNPEYYRSRFVIVWFM